jgi:Trk K+ transport system NAD-binding subunit
VVSLSGGPHESPLREKLDAIGFGFFIPLFFIMVGAKFDLPALLSSPAALLLVPLLLAGAYVVKLVPALLFRTRFSWRETWAAGALLSSRLSLIIAASAIALELGLLPPAVNAAIVLVAVVTCTVSPLLFGRILGTTERPSRQGVLILGTGPIARLIGGRLQRAGEQITFLGEDAGQLAELAQEGFAVAPGAPADPAVLAGAGAGAARALIMVSDASATVQAACRLARERFGIPVLLASTDGPQAARTLRTLGAQVVQPATATVLALESALRYPATFDLLTHADDDAAILEAQLTNPALTGQALRQVRLPGNALVLGIRRHDAVLIPHGSTVLQLADVLMLVGTPDGIAAAQQWIQLPGDSPRP